MMLDAGRWQTALRGSRALEARGRRRSPSPPISVPGAVSEAAGQAEPAWWVRRQWGLVQRRGGSAQPGDNGCASDGGSPGKSGVTAHTRTRKPSVADFLFSFFLFFFLTSSIPAAQRAPGSIGHAVSWSYAVSMVPLLLRKTASLSSVLFD